MPQMGVKLSRDLNSEKLIRRPRNEKNWDVKPFAV